MALEQKNLILNREIGLIKFNQRVLDQALNAQNPLLERFKYLCIASRNLDELFEVRIARLIKWQTKNPLRIFPDGLTATETLDKIKIVTTKLYNDIYTTYNSIIVPELKKQNIYIYNFEELSNKFT